MYAKVFSQIFDSSIADNYPLRHFFMDLLVLCDSEGVIDMTQEAISARTRIPIENVRALILELEKPDPRSRTPKENGSRLVRLSKHRDWGWRVVNYKSYRDIRDEDGRKHYMREYMRKYRGDNGPCKHDVNTRKQALTSVDPGKPMQIQKQKQIQKDIKTTQPPANAEFVRVDSPVKDLPEKLNTSRMQRQWRVWMTVRMGMKKVKSWPTLFNEQIDWLNGFDEATAHEILSASIRNGWQGLFEPKASGAAAPALKPYEIKTIIQAKETEAGRLKQIGCREGPLGDTWSEAYQHIKEEYFKLRREIKSLNQQLASMA